LYGAVFVLAIFVLPFIVSHFLMKALRMPTYAFRVGVMLAAITGGLLFAWSNNFPDVARSRHEGWNDPRL
jgi:hypothetical protein